MNDLYDQARSEQIYHSMAIALLGDALTRLAWYQKKLNLPLETAKGLTADVVINFYESQTADSLIQVAV